MQRGIVFDIMHYATHDGPGIRSVVFFKGCPLVCQWCHNPESHAMQPELILRRNLCIGCHACLEACPQGAISLQNEHIDTDLSRCTVCLKCIDVCSSGARQVMGREMSVEEVMTEIEKDIPFYDESNGGVTFSGGEPLFQPAFLKALLLECKRLKLHTALETSGFALWQVLDDLRCAVDLFLYDLKTINDHLHLRYTGVSNVLILENLRRLSESNHVIVLRVPVIPGFNDDIRTVHSLGTLASSLANLQSLDLLPYHNVGIEKYASLNKPFLLGNTIPPSEESIQFMALELRKYGLAVNIGG